MLKFVDDWRNAWRIQEYKKEFFVGATGLVVASMLMWVVLSWVETRNGVILHDPLLALFSPADLKWITYSLIYSGWLFGLISLCVDPFSLLLTIRSLIVLVVLRIACLYLLPLNPPADIIPLADPLARWLSIQTPHTRDLFFSWHTALLTLLAFTARWRDIKIIFLGAAAAVSLLLLLQHVQYTIDVVAAPCFAYVAYSLARRETIEKAPPVPGIRQPEKAKNPG